MSTSNAAMLPRPHLNYLDGVRGFAVACVLLEHSLYKVHEILSTSANRLISTLSWTISQITNGHVAVDVFIVLSGFCLALPVARKNFTLPDGVFNFYLRRARRILPPYYACMFLILCYFTVVHRYGNHTDFLPTKLQIVGNVFLLEDIFRSFNVINGVFWSVAIEWKIYFLLPVFLFLIRRLNFTLMLLAAGMIGIASILILGLLVPQNNLSRTCPWYVLLFAFGVAAAGHAFSDTERLNSQLGRQRLMRVFGPFTILFTILAIASYNLLPVHLDETHVGVDWHTVIFDTLVGALAANLLGVLALWNAAGSQNPVYRLFLWSPLVRLGRVGYSVYLMHPLAFMMVRALWTRLSLQGIAGTIAEAGAFIIFSLVISIVFYWQVESRFLNKADAKPKPVTTAFASDAATTNGSLF